MTNIQITTLWSTLIIEELVRHGIRRFCISPGSRSTPLTAAAARHSGTECTIFPDERAAAFFALGYARGSKKPAVLICTSGTAAANYFPGVVEASLDKQPMIVLSADRPFELLETGANQTIRQSGLFGNYTRWNFQLPEPSESTPAIAVLSAIDYAVKRSLGPPPGPVHLNLPFREPFDPVETSWSGPWVQPLENWKNTEEPLNSFVFNRTEITRSSLVRVKEILEKASRPFLAAGQLDPFQDAEPVLGLAKKMKAPLYCDITSQLRLHGDTEALQPLLFSQHFLSDYKPDAVLHLGGKIVGKHLAEAIRRWAPEHFIVVRNHPDRYNPDHTATLSIECPPVEFARLLAQEINRTEQSGLQLNNACRAIQRELDQYCSPENPVTEISTARIVSSIIPGDHGLFLANSMPIRDMDNYAALRKGCMPPSCGMNRGASGIDGNIASAAGFAQGAEKPVTLLIGDLSFLHDINSLTFLQNLRHPLTIVVINNNGGGIFSFLPVADQKDIFETHFGTPQNYSIRSAAETFGIPFMRPSTNGELIACYTDRCRSNVSGIIEITGTRDQNVMEHQKLNAELRRIIDRHL